MAALEAQISEWRSYVGRSRGVREPDVEELETHLREQIDDPRLIPVTGSAADVETILADRKLGAADYVLSGLPFSTLSPGVGNAIAEATSKVIRPGGAFLVYQFSPKVLDFIKPHFAPIKRGFEWINVPPATLFWAYNGEDA